MTAAVSAMRRLRQSPDNRKPTTENRRSPLPADNRIPNTEHLAGSAGRYVLDLETCELIAPGRPLAALGVACLCLYDLDSERFIITDRGAGNWNRTLAAISVARLLVGWNIRDFDLAVLAPHLPLRVADGAVCDLMRLLESACGVRYSLNTVARSALGLSKADDGADAPELWLTNRKAELHAHCVNDVLLTLMLLRLARNTGRLRVPGGDFPMVPLPPAAREGA